MVKKLTTDIFIERSNLIHENKYNYSLVNYIDIFSKINIICKNHGIFEQIPNNHLSGKGCIKCGGSEKLTTSEFIKKANVIHNFKYDYSLVKYKNNLSKINIICKNHGVFAQTPGNHLFGNGCPDCGRIETSKKQSFTNEEFIKMAIKIHSDLYNYSLVNYINAKSNIKIICLTHGIFYQTPDGHLNGHGCPSCSGNKKLNIKEFIDRANIVHNFKYDYADFVYKGISVKGIINCKKHGKFNQIAGNHLSGHGCSICGSKLNEKLIYNYLKNNNILFQKIKIKLPINKTYSFPDFYIPSLNLIIEYNGEQHYKFVKFGASLEEAKKKFKYQKIRDQQLRDYCKENNINLLEIDGRKYQGIKLKTFLEEYFRESTIK